MSSVKKMFHRQRYVQWKDYDFEGNGDTLGAKAAKEVYGYNIPTELLDLHEKIGLPYVLSSSDDPTVELMEDIQTLKGVHEIIYPGKSKKLSGRFASLDSQGIDACTICRDKEGNGAWNGAWKRSTVQNELEDSVMATTYDLLTFDRLVKLFKRARKLNEYLVAAIPKETPSSGVQMLEMVHLKQPDSLQVDTASTLVGDDSKSINGSIMSGSSATWNDGMSTIIGDLEQLQVTHDSSSKEPSPEFQRAQSEFDTIANAFHLYMRLHHFRGSRIGGKKLGTVFLQDHWQCLFYDLSQDQRKNGVLPQPLLDLARLADLYARLEAEGDSGIKLLEMSEDDDLRALGWRLWREKGSVIKSTDGYKF